MMQVLKCKKIIICVISSRLITVQNFNKKLNRYQSKSNSFFIFKNQYYFRVRNKKVVFFNSINQLLFILDDGLLLVLAIYLVHHVTAHPANQRSHRSIQQHGQHYPKIISNLTHLQCPGSVSIDLGSSNTSDTCQVDKVLELKYFCPHVTNLLHQLHEILLSIQVQQISLTRSP